MEEFLFENNIDIYDEDLTYALDSLDDSARMVFIEDVPLEKRGKACGCFCPKCMKPMVAKLGNDVPHRKRPHFAHLSGSNCHGYYMTALHRLAEQIIEDEKQVMFPKYKDIEEKQFYFDKVEVEQRVERKDLQPDIVGISGDGLRWFVEIRNTSEVKETKMKKIKESNITCLEIDVRGQTLEKLKSFLIQSSENRKWLNNPNYDLLIAEEQRKRLANQNKNSDSELEYKGALYQRMVSDVLPFDKYWTVGEYYKYLSSVGTYITDLGNASEIIRCNKANNGMLIILYKGSGANGNYYQYHIDVISTNNGELVKNNVADYIDKTSAIRAYSERLRNMNNVLNSKYILGNSNDNMPF